MAASPRAVVVQHSAFTKSLCITGENLREKLPDNIATD
jgi:hypothetical protein